MRIKFKRPERAGGPARVKLTGAFTIYEAAEAKSALLDALRRNDQLEIDLAAVAEIDTAAVQVLVLMKREAALANRRISIVHGAASLQAIDRYSLGAFFGDPVVLSARAPETRSAEGV